MQKAPFDMGCAGFGLMSSTTPLRTWTNDPQFTAHSLQVLATIVVSSGFECTLARFMRPTGIMLNATQRGASYCETQLAASDLAKRRRPARTPDRDNPSHTQGQRPAAGSTAMSVHHAPRLA